MAVSPRIHWVNLSFLPVLDVLPGGPTQIEAHHPAVGLHSRCDRGERAVADGQQPRDEVRVMPDGRSAPSRRSLHLAQ